MVHQRLSSVCLTIAPGEGTPPLQDEVYLRLIHRYEEPGDGILATLTSAHGLVLVVRGSGTVVVDGEDRAMRRHDCLRYRPGMHLAWRRGAAGTRLLRCTVKGSRAAAMLDAVGLAPARIAAAPPILVGDFAARVDALAERGAGTYDAVALAWMILAAFAPPRSPGDDLVDACVELMQERLDEGPGVEVLARELGVARSTLFRRFRDRFACSPKAWLDRQRLERAAHLLASGNLGVTEVAKRCGFSDASWFGRRFRSRFGCAPGDWRG